MIQKLLPRLWFGMSGAGAAAANDDTYFLRGAKADLAQDYKTALRWYRKAARQGDAEAQFILGTIYQDGKGVAQNYKTALRWYRKAAKQEHAKAQRNIGMLYANGNGVAQDYEMAAHWYQKAADQGNASAQHNLGLMYDSGDGVPQNHVEAYKWWLLAAAHGHVQILQARHLTPEQKQEAQAEAAAWQEAFEARRQEQQ